MSVRIINLSGQVINGGSRLVATREEVERLKAEVDAAYRSFIGHEPRKRT